MRSCAILDDYQDVARSAADWRPLAGAVDVHVFTEHVSDRQALVETLAGFEIIVAMRERTRFDRRLFERLPRLELLVTTGMRNAAIDLEAAAAHGVTICGTRGSVGSTAELTWGLILALMRSIPQEYARFRQGEKWQSSVGRDLRDRELGVVGFGNLGTRVARVGLAFGMKVSAWSRSLTRERCAESGVEYAGSLAGLLRASDVVTLHVTLNEDSRGLIGAPQLALMKPGAFLVNTSRGPIVEERALIAALRERRIAGAGLDVFDEEPLPLDHPYRGLDNLIATPHLGYVTEESYRIYYGEAVEDISAWLAGKPVRVLQAAS
ncbi:MAG: hydroxyacid dehydrogenase [Betaproteobacteria bacterium RIFCSPLOWO2_02_FULL_64_12]|nr:MAG: hydroxyacid dehydrogenase [Betaproteobacteria bacterium RIFCSPLOWO2_02_FULL_64_12]